MNRPLRAALSLVLTLCLALPLALPAQTPTKGEDEEPSIFGETVEVRVVNLEIVVTDRSGNRVSGLKPSELRLLVDGKPVSIDYFTEVAEGRSTTAVAAPAEAAPAGAGKTPAAVSAVSPEGEVGTSYLLFVDDYFTVITRDRNRILQGIAEDLERLRPQDRMAIVAFDGRKLARLADWSGSQETLRQAIGRAIDRRGTGLASAADVRDLAAIRDLDAAGDVGGGLTPNGGSRIGTAPGGPSSLCMTTRRFEGRLQRVVAGLTATMRSLAQAPGRKVALVVAGGWPRSAMDYLVGGPDPTLRQEPGCQVLGPKMYDPIFETANRLGFTLYPMLVPDLPSAIDAEHTSSPDPFSVNPQSQWSELQETMDLLARKTGGKAFAGGVRFDALDQIADDTRSYYWLGFTPTWKGDDRKHDVKVEVARPGLSVRARSGYQDLSRSSEVTFNVESSLLFGHAEGALPMRAQFGPVPAGRRDKVTVPLRMRIPLDHVTMIQQGREYKAELELRVAMLDDDGNRNEIPVLPVKLAGKEKPAPGQYVTYDVQVEVRRLHQEAVIALYDPPSGKLLEAHTELTP